MDPIEATLIQQLGHIYHWETSRDGLQEAAERWDRALEEAGMRMNKVKAEVMVSG